jgi:hypothetical protein
MIGFAVAAAACVPPMEASEPENVQQLCVNPQSAYETGYNQGMQRQHLDTGWVDVHCAPEMRQPVRQSFLDGYNAGASNAPTVVAVPAAFSSDCGGEGYSCRSWRGDRVCMGYGSPGDPCWFGGDCLSGTCDAAGGAKTCR